MRRMRLLVLSASHPQDLLNPARVTILASGIDSFWAEPLRSARLGGNS
jgi:hypothetical protein